MDGLLQTRTFLFPLFVSSFQKDWIRKVKKDLCMWVSQEVKQVLKLVTRLSVLDVDLGNILEGPWRNWEVQV